VRAYVTGGSGFVGTWLVRHLRESGDEVVASDLEVDVTVASTVEESLVPAAPEVVYHLAGFAHVGESWSRPAVAFNVNALGTLNVLQAAGRCARKPKVVVVSSSEVYGRGGGTAFDESAELRPVTPYAASKVAAEFLGLQAFLGDGLPVVRVRPFNHVGPGQGEGFVVSALARRVAEAERSGGTVAVGNLAAMRDFTDVRDVVRAYRLLALSGEAGEVYNVASGRGVTIQSIADTLVSLATGPVRLEQDPALVRAVDVPVLLGDPSKLRRRTGWEPAVPLDATLGDVLAYWRQRLG
jgi:GDP-4-dehydro-6-deoxy-D-mannose reductase